MNGSVPRLELAFRVPLVVLVLIGVLRPALPGWLQDHWGAAVVGLAFAGAAAELMRGRSRADPFEGYLFAALPLVLMVLFLQPQRVASDGIFYFAPLHSVVVDHDLNFENEYRVLGAREGYFHPTDTGRLPNNYSLGPAILWSPFYLAAHLLGALGLYRPTGFGYPYFTAIAVGTCLFGFVGVVLLYRLLRSHFDPPLAFATAGLIWLATFHIWYMVFEPSMSHAMAMASVTGFLLGTHRGVRGAKAFALMGAAGGLVGLIRWQNVLLLPVALVVSWARHGRPRAVEWLVGALCFSCVFAPQLLYWKALYGSYFLIPQGSGYLDWSAPEWEAVLFSSRHGLLSWSPILWLGLLGLPRFARLRPPLGMSLAVSAIAVWYVNASVSDWWAGASFGSRRFDGVLPAFGLGLAAALEWIRPRLQRHALAVAVALCVGPLLFWNAALMGGYFAGAIPVDGPVSFRQVAADGIELLHGRLGYPFSWPASLRARLTKGWPLATYELTGALSPANNLDIRMGDTDALHLGPGWSLPLRRPEATYRYASPAGASVIVSLREPAPYRLELRGRPRERARLHWNGAPVGEVEMGADGRTERLIPAEDVLAGVNILTFKSKTRRSFALSRLRLVRPGDVN